MRFDSGKKQCFYYYLFSNFSYLKLKTEIKNIKGYLNVEIVVRSNSLQKLRTLNVT